MHIRHRSRPRSLVIGLAVLAVAALATGCSRTTSGGRTAVDATTTTAGNTVLSSDTTATSATPAPTTPPTTAAGATCPGASGIPSGASKLVHIQGDIDGDLNLDTVTSYSLGGIPHVHAQLASGKQSDTALQIGLADTVEISFYDFDHSSGAAVPPPVAVLAVGRTKAGTAQFTFLTLTMKYCIRPWHIDATTMFVGRVSAEGPYSGLRCEGAMGSQYTSLTSAEPAGAGSWNVTTQLLHHDFTLIQMDAPQVSTVTATEAEIQQQYGDIVGCARGTLFS